MSEQEFKKIQDSAYQKTNAESYRTILKSQHFKHITDKGPFFQRSVITERTTDGYYEILEDKRGEKIERTETIEINNRKYVKKNNGKWEDVTPPPQTESFGGGFSTGGVIKNDKKTEQRYLGKTTVNSKTVDPYEQTITRQYENSPGLSIKEEKIWIDQKGRYLQTEIKSRMGDKNVFHMTVEYEYDPSIKITAPIK